MMILAIAQISHRFSGESESISTVESSIPFGKRQKDLKWRIHYSFFFSRIRLSGTDERVKI